MEGRVERIAREKGTAADDFAGEGGFVEGGEEFEGATGVVARGERAASSVHVGDEGGELRGVGRADVGWETLPGLREGIGFFLRGGREGEAPVIAGVAIEVSELDGGFLVVEADVGFLPWAQGAVDDGSDGAVGEGDDGHGHVFDFDVAVEGRGDGADLGPIAEEMEQMIHGVDTERHRGTAEVAGPFAAPRGGVVGGIAEPKGVADGHEGAAELAGVGEGADVRGGGREAHLEDAGGVAAGAFFCGFDRVELGEGAAERFFAEDPRAGLHGGNAHIAVEGGRGGDEDQIGLHLAQGGRVVGERGGNAVALAEGFDAGGVEVDGGDELYAALGGLDGAHMGVADTAGANEESAVGFGGSGWHGGHDEENKTGRAVEGGLR